MSEKEKLEKLQSQLQASQKRLEELESKPTCAKYECCPANNATSSFYDTQCKSCRYLNTTLQTENTALKEKLAIYESHEPDGRNVTNQQYIELKDKLDKAIKQLQGWADLVNESKGVYGCHLLRGITSWKEINEPDETLELIAELSAKQALKELEV